MTPFPHHYRVTLSHRTLSAPPREPIAVGPPPQFGGSDRDWSPEDLLVGATLECLWTTFEALARRQGLTIRDWTGTGVAILDRGAPIPVFTSITLSIDLGVDAGDEERGRALLETAERGCIISNALKVPVTLVANVVSRSATGVPPAVAI